MAPPIAKPQGGVAGRRHGGSVGAGERVASSPGMSAPTARKPWGGVISPSGLGAGNGPDAGWSAGSGEAKGPEGATDDGAGNPPAGVPAPRPGTGKPPVEGPWGRASGGGGGPTSTSSADPQPRRRRRQEPDGGPVTASARAAWRCRERASS
ncbi:hypothetical protein [Actinomycetospora cinnamomea]|uniref:hypothetical protein n=1 Tax=Actinomycetospora cinnamomea TaxID=663609 RepID=UPI001057C6AB|nr:hypothetical protein [Actinomycetospora cinnamomea]